MKAIKTSINQTNIKLNYIRITGKADYGKDKLEGFDPARAGTTGVSNLRRRGRKQCPDGGLDRNHQLKTA